MAHRLVAALLLLVPAASAQLVTFKPFSMDGLQCVPPKNTPATGTGHVTVNTSNNTVYWVVEWGNLVGMETFSHVHGPAAAGANAAVVFSLGHGPPPKIGEKQVTAQQVADLFAGKWYADVHTTNFPGGEIRGQVIPTVETWLAEGSGLNGTGNKIPRLGGEGPLTANSANKVTLSNAKANAMGILYIGNTVINQAFKGGTMIPAPDQTVVFQTDAQGMHVYNFHWPAGVPKYTNRYWQAWVKDAGAVKGFAASNGVRSTSG